MTAEIPQDYTISTYRLIDVPSPVRGVCGGTIKKLYPEKVSPAKGKGGKTLGVHVRSAELAGQTSGIPRATENIDPVNL